MCKSPAEFLTPDTWFSLHRCRLRIKTHRTHCSHRRRSTVSKVSDGISSCKRSRLVLMQSSAMRMMIPFGKLASTSILVAMALVRHQCLLQQLRSKRLVATGEVLACFRLRGGLSGKLRLDSSAKHCALLSVFGSRSIVFVLLSPGRIPSELLVVSAAGGLSVRGVQKSSVTCQLVPLVIS